MPDRPRSPGLEPAEVLFEFRRVGRYVRVAAVDPATNTEVVVVGAADGGEALLRQTALRKLLLVLRRARHR